MVSAATTLKGKALQLLAARDYTRAEMEKRLLHWLHTRARTASARANPTLRRMASGAWGAQAAHGHAHALSAPVEADHDGGEADPQTLQAQHQTEVATLLDALQSQGLLSDARAAEALVHRQTARMGAFRIAQALKNKGIDADLAAQLTHDLRSTEAVRAHALWQKKFAALPTTPAERAKQMRYLASRGFAADTIHQVMRGQVDFPEEGSH